jgi:ferredoxin
MSFRVKIDATACIGSGSCIAAAPAAFRRDDEGRAFPTPEVAGLKDEVLRDVARNCPSGAISLFDAEGEMVDVFGP